MNIQIPELSLIVLIGATGSGKSTFAKKWFGNAEIVSSDRCREMVSNSENTKDASADAFDLLYYIVGKRLKRGLLTVVDATNVRSEDRKNLVALAREYHTLPVAIVMNLPDKVCLARNEMRTDRSLAGHLVTNHIHALKRGIGKLKTEGFRKIFEFHTEAEVAAITGIEREPLWNMKKAEHGPFDIIGDIHGCYEELCTLLTKLGHRVDAATHSVEVLTGRKLLFLGDLCDRGPASPAVFKLVMNTVKEGTALCVPGNHDMKLLKYLRGSNVKLSHGLKMTVDQLAAEETSFIDALKVFLDSLVSHYVLDDGKLVVAHAGLKEEMHGRGSGAVREFCLYGETTGEIDEFGLPVRYNWASSYKGKAMVVYGHTPVYEPQWFNNTIDIDTGCVFGGKLTALRYPEKELVDVPALATYMAPTRPLRVPGTGNNLQHEQDDVLDIEDLMGKQVIETRLLNLVTVREEYTTAALETMSRFSIHPKWLIYLPPTMSPTETSTLPDYLEYPTGAFSYYKKNDVTKVICEEKHMGSRAVVIVCKDSTVVNRRFGLEEDSIGTCYTRTGRAFFTDKTLEQAFLGMVRDALTERNFWEEMDTDWVCLDSELMPWNAKAQALLQHQYAATGAAAVHAMTDVVETLRTAANLPELAPLLKGYEERAEMCRQFVDAYRQYCWEVKSLSDYQLAPFHILATEGKTYFNKDHVWHMETIARYCGGEGNPLIPTKWKLVDLEDERSIADAVNWWEALTAKDGEGMVVKSLSFIERGSKGLLQPAIKIRGREYLRIIYGPEYTLEANLNRLKKRGLGAKRGLALREFALGVQAIEHFVAKEPLRKVHQCVFGLLALESEPVDPRL
ncbi:polynucleotide kinase-phosphatase [Chitinophaga pinensis]|uniref:Bis(5'-nucleosyl)-tetraphosphatase(Asymmetrical) n=1 Tax=Chitinophaga pinensis (strain ATCC 43595 / DSM 2588 / LMG 13176 / NBRC 15968 / NCIMB 11800 / UQM 2034) TaxID=485918 RepID=A0A979G4Y3_CHIPD|nr:polynucleotide kinase-phosphatase [Chitinophaga pinensis]ACU60752.1 Bis(5'-nucleosyl)-tetraphosphatase(asymmetrical) [Chitinophaga pinensis DSM 2588]